MKNVKNLKIKTKEGLEVRNLQRFPSMEWGEEGGLSAELWMNGKIIATVFNAGDGGPADAEFKDNSIEAKSAILTFLQRVDPSYGPDTEYDWLKGKTVDSVDDEDVEAAVIMIEGKYQDMQMAKKQLKGDIQRVFVYETSDGMISSVTTRNISSTNDQVLAWLKKNHPENDVVKISSYTKEDLATAIEY